MSGSKKQTIDLRELAVAFSEALGLVGGEIVDHGKRVAYMAETFADSLPLKESDLEDLHFASLLHDAGISSTKVHQNLRQLDWEKAQQHCDDGAELLTGFKPFARPAELIKFHHTKWKDYGALQPESHTAIMANLIFLADRIDIMLDWDQDLLLGQEKVENRIKELSGTFFNPALVNIFLERSKEESFWLSLYPRYLQERIARHPKPNSRYRRSMDDLEQVAQIFGRIVDRKSPFTAFHSEGVSKVCDFLGTSLGLPEDRVQMLRIAGLLHDLGKLSVPDEILDKPGKLTSEEFTRIKHHPFETAYILGEVTGLEEIREWASFHHERPDGRGYPFHIAEPRLAREHIIVIVADILSALIQERPYRHSMPEGEAMDLLDHMSSNYPEFEPLVDKIRQNYSKVLDMVPTN